MARSFGVEHDAAEDEELTEEEGIPTANVLVDSKMSQRAILTTQRDLHGPPMSVLKLADLR